MSLSISARRGLRRRLMPDTSPGPFRQATVQAVTGSTVSLLIGGSDVPVPGVAVLAHYTPAANDTVIVGYFGPVPFVIGKQR